MFPPIVAADRPGAEPDARNLESGVAELCGLQLCCLHLGAFQ